MPLDRITQQTDRETPLETHHYNKHTVSFTIFFHIESKTDWTSLALNHVKNFDNNLNTRTIGQTRDLGAMGLLTQVKKGDDVRQKKSGSRQ